MSPTNNPRPTGPPYRNRRRFPRLEVLGQVEGQLMPLDVPLVIRDLSQGGFSTMSHVPFPPGSSHFFRFTTATGTEVMLEATAVHCRLAAAGADGHYSYVTGFEFHSDARTDEAASILIDTLSSVFSLE